MYGGIGIPIDAKENECVTVKNAIEIIVPFWDDLVQEKIKVSYRIFSKLKFLGLILACLRYSSRKFQVFL